MKATLALILIFKGISENPDLLEQLINLEGFDPVRSVQDKPLIATRFKLSGKHLHSVQKCVYLCCSIRMNLIEFLSV